MLDRASHRDRVEGLLRRHPVVGILGARQVGKTTLAAQIAQRRAGKVSVFDLEDPADRARLSEPGITLRPLRGLVILDEIQRVPDLFPLLRVLADRPKTPARFLVLGSASPDLLRQSSESLAGRIVYHELGGFSLREVGGDSLNRLWLRGSFPRSYLARTLAESREWRTGFVRTFLERDLRQLGVSIAPNSMERFWSMLAHYHAQLLNSSELARSFGVSDTTIRRYLDALTSTFMVRQLRPFHENLRKRQVRSPKIYVRDSGLLHTLLDVSTQRDLDRHPKVGASWEGFALEAVIDARHTNPRSLYFWGTHAGAELDLLVVDGRTRVGYEFKRTDAPKITRSMRIACEDLSLSRLEVVHAGEHSYPLDGQVRATSLSTLIAERKG